MMASMAGRYAVALFELAKEQGQLDRVELDLASLSRMLEESADLRRLVLSPVITADDQAKGLGALLAKAGITGLAGNFVNLIVRNRRLFALKDMIKAFRALLARERGEVSADVTSAHPLTPEQMRALADTLKTSIGKNVRIDAAGITFQTRAYHAPLGTSTAGMWMQCRMERRAPRRIGALSRSHPRHTNPLPGAAWC